MPAVLLMHILLSYVEEPFWNFSAVRCHSRTDVNLLVLKSEALTVGNTTEPEPSSEDWRSEERQVPCTGLGILGSRYLMLDPIEH